MWHGATCHECGARWCGRSRARAATRRRSPPTERGTTRRSRPVISAVHTIRRLLVVIERGDPYATRHLDTGPWSHRRGAAHTTPHHRPRHAADDATPPYRCRTVVFVRRFDEQTGGESVRRDDDARRVDRGSGMRSTLRSTTLQTQGTWNRTIRADTDTHDQKEWSADHSFWSCVSVSARMVRFHVPCV